MNLWIIYLISALLLLVSSVNAQHESLMGNEERQLYSSDELYLKFKEGEKIDLYTYLKSKVLGIEAIEKTFQIDDPILNTCYKLKLEKNTSIQEVEEALTALSLVEYCEKVPIHYTSLIPNDYTTAQWNLAAINAPNAWDITTGDTNIVIAIVDDAVRLSHEDLQANLWTNFNEIPNNGIDDDLNGYVDDIHGYDVANYDNNPAPPSTATNGHFSHGTHCAGIATGTTNNGIGMASIGYHCRLMAVKTKRDASLGSSLQAALSGMEYAIAAGANVVSMSFGSYRGSATYQLLIDYGTAQGIVFVAAAGNDHSTAPMYPASYRHVISVGATQLGDAKAGFSNYGATIDVMAPGQGIYSCLAGGDQAYGTLSGTSMACPLVAGLVGLMLSKNKELPPAVIEQCLKSTCDNIDAANVSYIGNLGAGRINARAALDCLPGIHADFTTEHPQVCIGATVNFIDQSTNSPTTWNWTFSGGTPSTSTAQNPAVTYAANGNYAVTLTVANAIDTSTVIDTVYIRPPTLTFSDSLSILAGYTVWIKAEFTGFPPYNFSYSDGNNTYTINTVQSPYYFSVSPSSTTTYTPISVSDRDCAGLVQGVAHVEVDTLSPLPCYYVNGQVRISENESGFTGPLSGTSPYWGGSMCTIGDLDLDGVNDLAVASAASNAVWILFLNPDGTVKRQQRITQNVGGFTGNLAGAVNFGSALDTLGDFDGDGVMDLVVGSHYDLGGGSIWLLYLNRDGTVKGHSKLSSTTGNLNLPWQHTLRFGASVTALGDLDGDGVTDIAVGASGNLNAAINGVFIVFLNSDGTAKGYQRIGKNAGGFNLAISNSSFFGGDLCSIGDLNQDGVMDLVVGNYTASYNVGEAYVLFLNTNGTVQNYTVLADSAWSIPLNFSWSTFFSSGIEALPDMNGDGIQDLLISASDRGRGEAYIFYMNRSGRVTGYIPYGHNLSNFQGIISGNFFGARLAYLGDIDNDGRTEIAVSQVGHQTRRGAVWILDLQQCCSINADFELSSTCLQDTVTFLNQTTTVGGTTVDYWAWSFGNGDTLTGIEQPIYHYTDSGTFQIQLIAGNFSGQSCMDTVVKEVQINAELNINYPDTIYVCPLEVVELATTQGICGAFPYTYQWNTSTGLSDSTSAAPQLAISQSRTYYVTVTDALGSSIIDTIVALVLPNCCVKQAHFSLHKAVYCLGDSLVINNVSLHNGATSYVWKLDGVVFSNAAVPLVPVVANTAGRHELSLVLQDSCGIDSSYISFVVLPEVEVDLGNDLNLCAGGTAVAGVPAVYGYDYVWSPNIGLSHANAAQTWVSPTTTMTYHLEVTNEWGCTGRDTLAVIVGTATIDTSVTNTGLSLVATASPATYTWINCHDQTVVPGATQQTFTPNANGSYAVVIHQNGCVATSACHNIVLTTVTQTTATNTWELYPNPVGYTTTIDLGMAYPWVELSLVDCSGKQIFQSNYTDKKTIQLNTASLAKGVYFINIQTPNQQEKYKIIKID